VIVSGFSSYVIRAQRLASRHGRGLAGRAIARADGQGGFRVGGSVGIVSECGENFVISPVVSELVIIVEHKIMRWSV